MAHILVAMDEVVDGGVEAGDEVVVEEDTVVVTMNAMENATSRTEPTTVEGVVVTEVTEVTGVLGEIIEHPIRTSQL